MKRFLATWALAALLLAGCGPKPESLTLATTTSVQDSGLLEELLSLFRRQTGIEVRVVAVGSGQALALGRRGDADVILAHDPPAEQRFMEEGHGSLRRQVMYNDFVLVGPPSDPAGVRGMRSAADAFARVARREAPFVSRGDESGTHAREKEVWRRAGVMPEGAWYIKAGAGMAHALRMADQKQAYTLSDRGTFLALRGGLDLAVLAEGDPLLVNTYSVLIVNPEKHPHIRHEAARKFADFLVSPEARKLISAFGADRHGRPLFSVSP